MFLHVGRAHAEAQLRVQGGVHELAHAHRAEIAIDGDPDPRVAGEHDVAVDRTGRAVLDQREGVVDAVARSGERQDATEHLGTRRHCEQRREGRRGGRGGRPGRRRARGDRREERAYQGEEGSPAHR